MAHLYKLWAKKYNKRRLLLMTVLNKVIQTECLLSTRGFEVVLCV